MNTTQQTIDEMKKVLSTGALTKADSVNIASGLVTYDLLAPARNLFPVWTPLRNVMPRQSRQGRAGDALHYKRVTALTGSGYNQMGWVPEGQRSAFHSITADTKTATYMTLGEEGSLTFEAEAGAQGFEDENARVRIRTLQKLMLKEEMAILGGNNSLALGTPATPTVAASNTGTIANGTYNVAVVLLTAEGYRQSSLAGGIATTTTITGADGANFVLNGGSSAPSATASTGAISATTNNITAHVAYKPGTVAYAWFCGTAGNEKLEAITTINSVNLTALAGTHQALSAITADKSTNTLAFDGLLNTALNTANNAYINTLATGVDGTGTKLTTNGRGGVTEIDAMLRNMFDNFQLSPTVIYVSSQEAQGIYNLILTNGSAPLLRYDVNAQASGEGYAITANGSVNAYFNPFTFDGGMRIPIKIHPLLAPGTIMGWSEKLPLIYQNNEVGNVAEVVTRRDYYSIDWPIKRRAREYGVYSEETLAIYAPFAMGVINNIAAG